MSDAIQSAILAAFSAALERAISQAVATHVQDLQTRLDDLADRTAQLENQAVVTSNVAAAGLDDELLKIKARLDELEATDARDLTKDQVRAIAEAAAEAAMDSHCSDYDHDDYDSHVGDDDKHFEGDIKDAVRDALSNMSFDVSIR